MPPPITAKSKVSARIRAICSSRLSSKRVRAAPGYGRYLRPFASSGANSEALAASSPTLLTRFFGLLAVAHVADSIEQPNPLDLICRHARSARGCAPLVFFRIFLERIALLTPRAAVIVIPAPFPEAPPIMSAKFVPPPPLPA